MRPTSYTLISRLYGIWHLDFSHSQKATCNQQCLFLTLPPEMTLSRSLIPLQALNVLLQTNDAEPKGVTAKIADFGLSVKMNQTETHVSNMFQAREDRPRGGGGLGSSDDLTEDCRNCHSLFSTKSSTEIASVLLILQGTVAYMSPETLLTGQQSNAADVWVAACCLMPPSFCLLIHRHNRYAFGITLWELYTGGHPFKGVPQAVIGHKVSAT